MKKKTKKHPSSWRARLAQGRRRLALWLCAAVLLTGCAGAGGAQADRTAGVSESRESTVVTMWMPGASDEAACKRISEKLSEITQEKLGFSVEITQLPAEEYEDSLWKRMMRQEMPDLFYLSEDQPITSYVYEDCLSPLSSLLNERKTLYGLFTEKQWTCKQKYRIVYEVPAGTTDCYSMGFFARSDLLEAMGADVSDISNLQQLRVLLEQVKDTWPDVVPVVSDNGRLHQTIGEDPLGDDTGVLLDNQGTTVTNLYASEEYQSLCSEMYQWYQEGLILKNACLRTEPATDLLKACNGFGFFAKVSSDSQSRYSRAYGQELMAIRLGPVIQNSSGMADGWCLPAQESRKEQAMDLLQFLYTDTEAAQLFLYGESGTDDTAQGTDVWQNTCVNCACLQTGETVLQQEEAGAVKTSAAYGFVYRNSDLVSLQDECKAIEKRYNNALLCGYLNPAEALPQFLGELQAAGIDSILEDKQQQLDSWLSAVRQN